MPFKREPQPKHGDGKTEAHQYVEREEETSAAADESNQPVAPDDDGDSEGHRRYAR